MAPTASAVNATGHALTAEIGVELNVPYLVTTPGGKQLVATPTTAERTSSVEVTFDVERIKSVAAGTVKTTGTVRTETLTESEINFSAKDLEALNTGETETTYTRC